MRSAATAVYLAILAALWTAPFNPMLNTADVLIPVFIGGGVLGLIAVYAMTAPAQ